MRSLQTPTPEKDDGASNRASISISRWLPHKGLACFGVKVAAPGSKPYENHFLPELLTVVFLPQGRDSFASRESMGL
jgi:hypothetical protein